MQKKATPKYLTSTNNSRLCEDARETYNKGLVPETGMQASTSTGPRIYQQLLSFPSNTQCCPMTYKYLFQDTRMLLTN